MIQLISLEDTISDIYNFLRYHTHDQDYKVVTSLLQVENHKFLRHIPTRWLQCIAVVSRLVEQFDALVFFFNEFMIKNPKNSRGSEIKKKLDNPFTLCILQFLATTLKPLQAFEKSFQTSGCHIHRLWKTINELLLSGYSTL